MEITRRVVLKGTGGALALALFGGIPGLRALARPSQRAFFRTLAAGPGGGFSPFVGLLFGLAGYEEALAEHGLNPATLVPAPGGAPSTDEVTGLLLGFAPVRASYSSGQVSIEGSADPETGYIGAIDRRVFYSYSLYGNPVVEQRQTPSGIPYEEVEVWPRTEPELTTTIALIDQQSKEVLASTSYSLPSF